MFFPTTVLCTLSHLSASVSIFFPIHKYLSTSTYLHILIPEKKEESNFLEINLNCEEESSKVDFEEMKVGGVASRKCGTKGGDRAGGWENIV